MLLPTKYITIYNKVVIKEGEDIEQKKASKEKIDYIRKYNEAKYKRYELKVKKEDTNIINKLSQQKSVNAYIIDLIKKDI